MVKYMKKKIIALSLAIVIAALGIVIAGVNSVTDARSVSDGSVNSRGAANSNIAEDYFNGQMGVATDIFGVVSDLSDIGGDIISNVGGDLGLGNGDGIGGIVDGAGDILGGIFGGDIGGIGSIGGNTVDTYAPQNTTGGYIVVVPAATDYYTEPDPNMTVIPSESGIVGETVDFGSDTNPYTKPVGELKGGDTGDGVRWIQWMFIYTRYGLKDNGITGVFDEDTMAVVKKLQKENGMVVDGIVDEEVIDKIEYLYYQSIYLEPATFAPVSTTSANPLYKAEVEDDASTAIIIVLVSAVWILAIVLIIVIKVTKDKSRKKKMSSYKEDETTNNK